MRPAPAFGAKAGVKAAFDLEKPHAGIEEAESGVGQRVLTHDELRAVLPHLSDPRGRCCKFLLLTGARLREATEATWAEIDPEARTWTVRQRGEKTLVREPAVNKCERGIRIATQICARPPRLFDSYKSSMMPVPPSGDRRTAD
jgi:integrase